MPAAAAEEDGEEGDEEEEGDPDPGADVEQPTTRSAARKVLKAERDRAGAVLPFSGWVLANREGKRALRGMMWIGRPLEKHFNHMMTAYKSLEGCREQSIGWACGDYGAVLDDIVQGFFDPAFTDVLDMHRMVTVEQLAKDEMLCRRLFKQMVAGVGKLAVMSMLDSECPPSIFLALLRPSQRQATLEKCKTLMVALENLDKHALRDTQAKAFRRDLYYPQETFCREALVTLSETSFAGVATDLEEELQEWSMCPHSTLWNEQLNRAIHGGERYGTSEKLGHTGSYHRALSATTHQDFERPIGAITPAARAASTRRRRVPDDFFVATRVTPPFEEEVINDLKAASPSFPTLSPENHRRIGMATQLMISCTGDWVQMSLFPLNLLCSTETVMRHRDGETLFIYYVCKWGLIGSVCKFRRYNGTDLVGVVFTGAGGHTAERKYVNIKDASDWRVIETRAMAPGAEGLRDRSRRSLRLLAKSNGLPLLNFAASRGFKNMTVDNLRWLHKHIGAPKPMPPRKRDLIGCLARFVDPTLSPDDVESCMDAAEKVDDEEEAFCTPNINVNELADLMDDETDYLFLKTTQEMQKKVQACRERREAAAARSAPQPKPASPPRALVSRRPFPVDKTEWTQAEAREYLPEHAKISLHIVGGYRWSVLAPYLDNGTNRSRAFGSDGRPRTSAEALVVVLKLVWVAYERRFSLPCPYEWPECQVPTFPAE